MNDSIQYGLARRLAGFRHELAALGPAPTREHLQQVVGRARQLGFDTGDVAPELEMVQGQLDAMDVQHRIEMGMMPVADDVDALSLGEVCHFSVPVRFGRRRADQCGHLLFTSGSIRFRGAIDLSIAWNEVSGVARDERELVVSMHQSRRSLRFRCHSYSDASVGVVLGQHLMQTVATGSQAPASGLRAFV